MFSPTSDSPFQPEFTPLSDNHILNADSNANVIASKFEDAQGRQAIDSQDGAVPMTGITITDNGASGEIA